MRVCSTSYLSIILVNSFNLQQDLTIWILTQFLQLYYIIQNDLKHKNFATYFDILVNRTENNQFALSYYIWTRKIHAINVKHHTNIQRNMNTDKLKVSVKTLPLASRCSTIHSTEIEGLYCFLLCHNDFFQLPTHYIIIVSTCLYAL